MSEQIVDKPEKKKPLRKLLETSLTILIWVTLVFILIRIASLLIWGALAWILYKELISPPLYLTTLRVLLLIFLLALFIFCLSQGWATYNYRRYGKRNRRLRSVKHEEKLLLEKMGISVRKSRLLKKANVIKVKFQKDKKQYFIER